VKFFHPIPRGLSIIISIVGDIIANLSSISVVLTSLDFICGKSAVEIANIVISTTLINIFFVFMYAIVSRKFDIV